MSIKIKISEKLFIKFLILITPFLDSINGFLRWIGISSLISFGQAVRIILFVGMFYLLTRIWVKAFFVLIPVMCILLIKNIFYDYVFKADLMAAITFDIRCLYVLLTCLVFYREVCCGKVADYELISWAAKAILINAVIIIFGYVTGVGLNYVGASKGFFIEQNSLIAVQVWGTCIWIYLTFGKRLQIENLIKLGMVLFSTGIQATKTGIAGIVLCAVYAMYYFGLLKKKWIVNILLIVAALVVGGGFVQYYQSEVGSALITRWRYFYERMDILSFLLSNRNDSLKYAYQAWSENPVYVILGVNGPLAGIEMTAIYSKAQGLIEMDIFDMIFFYGIIGGGIISVYIIKTFVREIKRALVKDRYSFYAFSLVVLLGISFTGGHVLTSPMAGVYLATILAVLSSERAPKRT